MRIKLGPLHTGVLRPTTIKGLNFEKNRGFKNRNYYCVSPNDYVHKNTEITFQSPKFNYSPKVVIETLRYIVLSLKNSEILRRGQDTDTGRMWIEWSVRTPLMRFPDYFTAEAFPEDPSNPKSQTILAMCGESLFGLCILNPFSFF